MSPRLLVTHGLAYLCYGSWEQLLWGDQLTAVQMNNYCEALFLCKTLGFYEDFFRVCRNASWIGPQSFISHLSGYHPSLFAGTDAVSFALVFGPGPPVCPQQPPPPTTCVCEHLSQVTSLLVQNPLWLPPHSEEKPKSSPSTHRS